MKILLIHNYYRYRGGEETYLELQVKLLRSHGHTVVIFSKDNRNIKNTTTSLLHLGFTFAFHNKSHAELQKLLVSYKPDIVHIHNIFPLIGPGVYKLIKQYNIPIVQTIHNYRFLCPNGILFKNGKTDTSCLKRTFPYHSFISKCYHNSFIATTLMSLILAWHRFNKTFEAIDYFIFPSQLSKDIYNQYYSTLLKKSTVIPHFVYETKHDKIKQNEFIYVGRLSDEKGILNLLQIFTELSHINLTVIGDGPLREQIEKFQSYPNIQINGHEPHEKVLESIANAKCLIIPSLWLEVLPFVYLESLSCGTPTLTPNTLVFTRSIARDRKFYFRNGDFKDLKDKIEKIHGLNNIQRKKFYSEYQAHHLSNIHYEKLKDIYNLLLRT